MPSGVYVHKKGRLITWGDKISKALIGKKFTKKRRQNISKGHKGQIPWIKGKIGYFKHTEEAKRKIGLASKGNTYCLGKKLSKKTRRAMSKASKGKIISSEIRQKISQTLTGRKRPDMMGENNPMFNHPNAYKSRFGKTGYRKDLKIFVRSKWEANIIRIFKFLGFNIQYEPQSFRLSDGTTYRPDLYIHETGELVEIKGCWLKNAKKKIKMFKREYPKIKFEIIDKIKYKQYLNEYSSLIKLEAA